MKTKFVKEGIYPCIQKIISVDKIKNLASYLNVKWGYVIKMILVDMAIQGFYVNNVRTILYSNLVITVKNALTVLLVLFWELFLEDYLLSY